MNFSEKVSLVHMLYWSEQEFALLGQEFSF